MRRARVARTQGRFLEGQVDGGSAESCLVSGDFTPESVYPFRGRRDLGFGRCARPAPRMVEGHFTPESVCQLRACP
jgi:hypothetical protein